ncbi:MAG TPA: hypothetical protein VN943_17590 [Candidatus Acidoferrum sp.]|nr:hypothetical protein [Candidatus Acidoferrum sp.]
MPTSPRSSHWLIGLLRQRSVQIAILLWLAASLAVFPVSGGKLPFNRPLLNSLPLLAQVIAPFIVLIVVFVEMAITYFLTRRRILPDMAARAPERGVARREILLLWLYGAAVLLIGHWLGLRLFGEGIGLHLNGSLFGHTREVSPREVWTWAFYNFILLAVIPYAVFRARGYSREALNLKSSNLKNDALVIFVIMALGSALDLAGGGFLQLSAHQMLVGAPLTFFTHLLGTGLPVMIFIYAILFPRYLKITGSPVTTLLLGALSYAALHIFEYWTLYDSLPHALLSVIFALLTFFPPGLMKSYLTLRTANAWVHLWGYHAVTPHVTADTPMIVHIFGIH